MAKYLKVQKLIYIAHLSHALSNLSRASAPNKDKTLQTHLIRKSSLAAYLGKYQVNLQTAFLYVPSTASIKMNPRVRPSVQLSQSDMALLYQFTKWSYYHTSIIKLKCVKTKSAGTIL